MHNQRIGLSGPRFNPRVAFCDTRDICYDQLTAGNTLRFVPPLTVDAEAMDMALDATDRVLGQLAPSESPA